MIRSTDRILTTHAGSLPRPDDLRQIVAAKARGALYDPRQVTRSPCLVRMTVRGTAPPRR